MVSDAGARHPSMHNLSRKGTALTCRVPVGRLNRASGNILSARRQRWYLWDFGSAWSRLGTFWFAPDKTSFLSTVVNLQCHPVEVGPLPHLSGMSYLAAFNHSDFLSARHLFEEGPQTKETGSGVDGPSDSEGRGTFQGKPNWRRLLSRLAEWWEVVQSVAKRNKAAYLIFSLILISTWYWLAIFQLLTLLASFGN